MYIPLSHSISIISITSLIYISFFTTAGVILGFLLSLLVPLMCQITLYSQVH